MSALNVPLSIFLYALCMFAYSPISDLTSELVGATLIWVAAGGLVAGTWQLDRSMLAPLWQTLAVAGVLGVTAVHVESVLQASQTLPDVMGQMHILMVLAFIPTVVSSAPILRWLSRRYL